MLLIATKLLDAFGLKVVGGSPAALDNLLISLKRKFVRIDHFKREHQNHHCNITVSPKHEKSQKLPSHGMVYQARRQAMLVGASERSGIGAENRAERDKN